MKTVLTGIVTGIVLVFLIQVFLSPCAMAEKPKEQPVEEEEEGYVRGLTSEEIMNLPDLPDEDDETAGMTIDEIIERANQRSRAMEGDGGVHESDDGTYIVQGDIAMTKEQYEEYMAEWKKQEAELIAKGEMKPDK